MSAAKKENQFAKPIQRAVRLNAAHLHPAEHFRTVRFARVDNNVTIEDILKPLFWTHCSGTIKAGDRVEIMPQDGSWYAEFMVMATGTTWSRVVLLQKFELDKAPPSPLQLADYDISYGSPTTKHRVLDKATRQVIKDGFETKEAAQKFIEDLHAGKV